MGRICRSTGGVLLPFRELREQKMREVRECREMIDVREQGERRENSRASLKCIMLLKS